MVFHGSGYIQKRWENFIPWNEPRGSEFIAKVGETLYYRPSQSPQVDCSPL